MGTPAELMPNQGANSRPYSLLAIDQGAWTVWRGSTNGPCESQRESTMNSGVDITAKQNTDAEAFDVIIIGAGLSGIGAAVRLQRDCPDRSFILLERRESIGGTWDLFRYPGIRSDSDMHTLGYDFKPWEADKSIADGPSILSYVNETADEYRIRDRIRFSQKLLAADWSSERGQ